MFLFILLILLNIYKHLIKSYYFRCLISAVLPSFYFACLRICLQMVSSLLAPGELLIPLSRGNFKGPNSISLENAFRNRRIICRFFVHATISRGLRDFFLEGIRFRSRWIIYWFLFHATISSLKAFIFEEIPFRTRRIIFRVINAVITVF